MKNDEIKKQLELEVRKDDGDILTPWQIQDFISKLANNYYKLDLINTISKKLNSGVDKEKFIIINESFNYNNSYSFLESSNILDLNNENEFKHFYHLGKPIPMFPVDNIYKLNIKFSLFSELNHYLGKKKIEKISKKEFHKVVFEDNDNYKEISNLINLNKIKLDDKEKIKINEDIEDIFNKYKLELKEFYSDKEKINDVIEIIDKNEFEKLDKYGYIERKYFKIFSETINKLDRPIVGIYNKEKNEVEILGSSFINKRTRDERFLDIKEISHNSPTYVHMFIGLSFVTPVLIMLKSIVSRKEDLKRERELASRKENLKIERGLDGQLGFKFEEIRENNDKFDKSIKELENLLKEENLVEHENIKNEYYKERFNQLHNEVVSKSVNNFVEYKFENTNLESKIINFNDLKKKNK